MSILCIKETIDTHFFNKFSEFVFLIVFMGKSEESRRKSGNYERLPRV